MVTEEKFANHDKKVEMKKELVKYHYIYKFIYIKLFKFQKQQNKID